MRKLVALAVPGILVLSFAVSGARAETPEDKWRFEIAPYIWAPGLSGDTGVRDRTVSVDADFAQVIHDSDSIIGLMLHTEAGRGRWSGFVDVTYAKIGVEDTPLPAFPGFSVDTTSSTLWLEAGGAYRFIDGQPLGASDSKFKVSVDGLLGARLTVLGFELSASDIGASVDQTSTWVDPFIGARARFDFGEHWALSLRGDVGGFGAGSQFTWQAIGLIGYKFNIGTCATTVFAGYRALGQDFQDTKFEWDMVIHGPMVGINFAF